MALSKDNQHVFIEELYRKMFLQLNIYAKRALNDAALGEEAVQDTFRIACNKIEELMASPNPQGWIMKTLQYVISNTKKSRAILLKTLFYTAEINELSRACTKDEIDPEITYGGIVSTEEFTLLKTIAIERHSILEAAQELGISVSACKKRLQRIREKLRERLEN